MLVSTFHPLETGNATLRGSLDSPVTGEKVNDQQILLAGWVYKPLCNPASCRVQAALDGIIVGETQCLFPRADVSAELGLHSAVSTGFRILCRLATPASEPRAATLRVTVAWADESPRRLAERQIELIPAALDTRPYGTTIQPDNPHTLRPEHLYGSGPPLVEPGAEAAQLLRDYLPRGASVVDVGCGAGAYGPGLLAAGHRWIGLEKDAGCHEILRQRQLPFRSVLPETGLLPGGDEEWDSAICVEVLEHLPEPHSMVKEIARICRHRALFAVPNIEVLPYLHDWGVVPWHLLEADHRNFFTRGSLRHLLASSFRHVEVFPYHEHPLRTRDGLPVYLHLFAVAEK